MMSCWVLTQLFICSSNSSMEVSIQCWSSSVGATPSSCSCRRMSPQISPILKCGYIWITSSFCCSQALRSLRAKPTRQRIEKTISRTSYCSTSSRMRLTRQVSVPASVRSLRKAGSGRSFLARSGTRGLLRLTTTPCSYLTPYFSSSSPQSLIISCVALTMLFSLFHSRNSLIAFAFSVRQDRQDSAILRCTQSQASMNSSRSKRPCALRKRSSERLLPSTAFQRALRRARPRRTQRLEEAMLGSLRQAMRMSTPFFSRKSFLFFLQPLQRLATMVRHSSLISMGFSSPCRNSSRQSITPSSLIFTLQPSSKREALAKALRHFSLRSMSLALERNLVRQKMPFFSSKSSFMCSTTFASTDSACPCSSRSCGTDHLVTAYELFAESMYSSRQRMKCDPFANPITFSSRDSIAFSSPDHSSFFSYRSSALVPNSTFLSAERVLVSQKTASSTVEQLKRISRKAGSGLPVSLSALVRKRGTISGMERRQLTRMTISLRRHLSSSLQPSLMTLVSSRCSPLTQAWLLSAARHSTPTPSMADQKISKPVRMQLERKSSPCSMTSMTRCSTPFLQSSSASLAYIIMQLISSSREKSSLPWLRQSQSSSTSVSSTLDSPITRSCLVPSAISTATGEPSALPVLSMASSLLRISGIWRSAKRLRQSTTASRRSSRWGAGAAHCWQRRKGSREVRNSGTQRRQRSSSEPALRLNMALGLAQSTSSTLCRAGTISSTPRSRSARASSKSRVSPSTSSQKKPWGRSSQNLMMALALRSWRSSVYSDWNMSRTLAMRGAKGTLGSPATFSPQLKKLSMDWIPVLCISSSWRDWPSVLLSISYKYSNSPPITSLPYYLIAMRKIPPPRPAPPRAHYLRLNELQVPAPPPKPKLSSQNSSKKSHSKSKSRGKSKERRECVPVVTIGGREPRSDRFFKRTSAKKDSKRSSNNEEESEVVRLRTENEHYKKAFLTSKESLQKLERYLEQQRRRRSCDKEWFKAQLETLRRQISADKVKLGHIFTYDSFREQGISNMIVETENESSSVGAGRGEEGLSALSLESRG